MRTLSEAEVTPDGGADEHEKKKYFMINLKNKNIFNFEDKKFGF